MKYVVLLSIMFAHFFSSSAMDQTNNNELSLSSRTYDSAREQISSSHSSDHESNDDAYYNENPPLDLNTDFEKLFNTNSPLDTSSSHSEFPTRGLKGFMTETFNKHPQNQRDSSSTSEISQKLAEEIRAINNRINTLTNSLNSVASIQQQQIMLTELKLLAHDVSIISKNLLLHSKDSEAILLEHSIHQQEATKKLNEMMLTLKTLKGSVDDNFEDIFDSTENLDAAIKQIGLQSCEHAKAISTCNTSLLTCIKEHQNRLDDLKKILQVQRCNQRCEMVGISSIVIALAAIVAYTFNSCPC